MHIAADTSTHWGPIFLNRKTFVLLKCLLLENFLADHSLALLSSGNNVFTVHP